jgi:hypothetical protein
MQTTQCAEPRLRTIGELVSDIKRLKAAAHDLRERAAKLERTREQIEKELVKARAAARTAEFAS